MSELSPTLRGIMSTTRAVAPARPDPAQVREAIGRLDGAPDKTFAEIIADTVMAPAPDPAVQAALRSPVLVAKSLAAVEYHIAQANARLKRHEGESDKAWRRRQEHFKHRMGVERTILRRVEEGVRAQRGIVPNRPNPRQWALEQLKESEVTVHCDCGATHRVPLYVTFKRLFEGRKAELKRQRKAARRAAKKPRR